MFMPAGHHAEDRDTLVQLNVFSLYVEYTALQTDVLEVEMVKMLKASFSNWN